MNTTVYIINHTHWDREWFLTSIYTSQWITGLIDKIAALAANNPDFKFLLDGQTLVIEDLLKVAPEYESKVRQLVRDGHLIIGPYYCQPDWQLTSGEALIRNLLYGWRDMRQFDGKNEAGWLVDTFGHISQAPQLHLLFGLDAVYVWRGVPQMIPFFLWEGSDGQRLFTINLFGGYRNLYGVTHAPEVAVKRLQAEVEKLQPYYPAPAIPLFDGYDLEEDPEDPMGFYRQEQASVPPGIRLVEAAPAEFARAMRATLDDVPVLSGELNSGKYGATFPGTFSARTYLKIMARDCEHVLYQFAEPLAVMARVKGRPYDAAQYEAWARLLLQNSVHDCICGVSIDQVHEKMEFHYRTVWDALRADIRESLHYILRDCAPGPYAVSTNPLPYEGWHVRDGWLYPLQTDGLGVWPLGEPIPVEQPREAVETFSWRNEHYSASVGADGVVRVGDAHLGQLVLLEEHGDTYSDEPGQRTVICRPDTLPQIEERSTLHARLRYECTLAWGGVRFTATVRLTFDQSPLLRWQVEIDSRGTGFRVEMLFRTALPGQLYAGMPFDVVDRPATDTDLLPRQLDRDLAKVLLGQRELEAVHTFPFHDFVGRSDGARTAVIFAKGLHAYHADEDGGIALTLRRSVEWLTAADLPRRVGDAGPFFYVPDARSERKVRHEIAACVADTVVDEMALQHLNAGFQDPPLVVTSRGGGSQSDWQFLRERLPMSALFLQDDTILARFYNPTAKERALREEYAQSSARGEVGPHVRAIQAKQILTVVIDRPLPDTQATANAADMVTLEGFEWRVGENRGRPDPQVIATLQEKIAGLQVQVRQMEEQLERAEGRERYLLEHRYYILKRELYEFLLSVRLNELKLAAGGELSQEYLFNADEQIATLGLQLNRLRIKRRIYDYIVEAI